MGRREEYREELSSASDVIAFLRAHSGLPGPRGKMELLEAAADFGDDRTFHDWIIAGSGSDPTDEFVAMCGVVGLGQLIGDGREEFVGELHSYASDPRWRVREAVAMAFQRVGDRSTDALFRLVRPWAGDRPYVQRAAIAAVSEPRLLKMHQAASQAVELVDAVTATVAATVAAAGASDAGGAVADRRSDEFRTLRQALGYCWSVVVAADPADGRPAMERWARSGDPDIRWILKENLKKARLARIDSEWVARLRSELD